MNNQIKDFGQTLVKSYLWAIPETFNYYFGSIAREPRVPKPKTKSGIAGMVAGSVLMIATVYGGIRAAGKGFEYYLEHEAQPKIVYLVDGKEVEEKRFNTNEELKAYDESKEGKEKAAYYMELNTHKARK